MENKLNRKNMQELESMRSKRKRNAKALVFHSKDLWQLECRQFAFFSDVFDWTQPAIAYERIINTHVDEFMCADKRPIGQNVFSYSARYLPVA